VLFVTGDEYVRKYFLKMGKDGRLRTVMVVSTTLMNRWCDTVFECVLIELLGLLLLSKHTNKDIETEKERLVAKHLRVKVQRTVEKKASWCCFHQWL
jgi:hypothetical protein